ncbi:MAG: hypothetical protein M0R32_05720 [Candidatus Cloacimonetes bacterium]|jgi:hypothetical protein|nr:hypothetical protein [Candidatus Cloacimonadota bacterium]
MSLINRKAVKQAILDTAKAEGRTDFTRVGSGSFDFLEEVLKKTIQDEVLSHPAIGKTINLGEVTVEDGTPKETPAPEVSPEPAAE